MRLLFPFVVMFAVAALVVLGTTHAVRSWHTAGASLAADDRLPPPGPSSYWHGRLESSDRRS